MRRPERRPSPHHAAKIHEAGGGWQQKVSFDVLSPGKKPCPITSEVGVGGGEAWRVDEDQLLPRMFLQNPHECAWRVCQEARDAEYGGV